MKFLRTFGLLLSVFAVCWLAAQERRDLAKSVVVKPTLGGTGAQQQQLVLQGVKAPRQVAGLRVFVDPKNKALDSANSGYVGTVYFSHPENNDSHEGSFVLTLPKRVTAPARVVISPISSSGAEIASSSAELQLEAARIEAVDNSKFK